MTARTKTLALLAAGTTVVGGAAGTAVASAGPDAQTRPGGNGAAKHRSHHGKELRKLARALDVRPGELRKALREASEESADAGLEKFSSVLGVSPDQVRDALETVQEQLTGADTTGAPEDGTPGAGVEAKINALVEALAKELGVEPAKVVEAGKQAREAGKAAFVETLAEELDLDVDEVTEALDRVTPDRGAKQPGAPAPGGDSGTPQPAPTV